MRAYNMTVGKEIFAIAQLPHSIRADSTIFPHIHFSTDLGIAGNRYLAWELEVVSFGNGEQIPVNVSTFPVDILETFNGAARSVNIPAAGIAITGQSLSRIFHLRLRRVASSTGTDYPNGVYLHGFDIHYQVGRMGGLT